jgi:hypothetical protein
VVFYWSFPGGGSGVRIAKFQSLVEPLRAKLMRFLCFFAFFVKKTIKHVGFCICNLAVAATPGRRRAGMAKSKSFFDQQLDAQVFHVKQNVNNIRVCQAPGIGFHFLPLFAFGARRRIDFVAPAQQIEGLFA